MIKKKNALAISIILTLAVFVGAFLFIAKWETNDDFSIYNAIIASKDGFSEYQNILLGKFIKTLYDASPLVPNWWFLVQYTLIMLSSVSIMYALSRVMKKKLWLMLLPAVCVTLFWASVEYVNFTRTAAVTAIAGAVLMIEGILADGSGLYRSVCTAFGCLMFMAASMLRFQIALVPLPFMMMAAFYRLFVKDGKLSEITGGIRNGGSWKRFSLVLLPCVLIIALSFMNGALTSDENKAYSEYNAARSAVQDYGSFYPDYGDEVVEKTGFEWVEYASLFNWMDGDPDVFTVETLGKLDGLKEKLTVKEYFYNFAATIFHGATNHITMLSVELLLLLLFIDRRRSFLPIVLNAVAFLAYLAFLTLKGRVVTRVWQPILLLVVIVSFIMTDTGSAEEDPGKKRSASGRTICIIFAVIALLYPMKHLVVKTYQNIVVFKNEVIAESAKEAPITDIVDADGDSIFIVNIADSKLLYDVPNEDFPILTTPINADYCDNLFPLGGWNCRMPYNVERLQNVGIPNPMNALIEDPRVYSEYSALLFEYLQKKFPGEQTVSGMKFIDDVLVVKYCSQIDDEDIALSDEPAEMELVMDVSYNYSDSDRVRHVGFKVDPAAIAKYDALYINVDSLGERKTYRVEDDGSGKLEAYLFFAGDGFEAENANVLLFGRAADGSYEAIVALD